MTGHNIGYIRVSSVGQDTDRQQERIGLEKIFTEKDLSWRIALNMYGQVINSTFIRLIASPPIS